MQSNYPVRFEREMACTETEWLRWLPPAIGACHWQRSGTSAQVCLPDGHLRLSWAVCPPRVIALARLPVLRVVFVFDGPNAAQRLAFMKRFDLYMQRGGG